MQTGLVLHYKASTSRLISAFQGAKRAIRAVKYLERAEVLVVLAEDSTVATWRLQI